MTFRLVEPGMMIFRINVVAPTYSKAASYDTIEEALAGYGEALTELQADVNATQDEEGYIHLDLCIKSETLLPTEVKLPTEVSTTEPHG